MRPSKPRCRSTEHKMLKCPKNSSTSQRTLLLTTIANVCRDSPANRFAEKPSIQKLRDRSMYFLESAVTESHLLLFSECQRFAIRSEEQAIVEWQQFDRIAPKQITIPEGDFLGRRLPVRGRGILSDKLSPLWSIRTSRFARTLVKNHVVGANVSKLQNVLPNLAIRHLRQSGRRKATSLC